MATAHDHVVKAEQLLTLAEDAPTVPAAVLQNLAAVHIELAKVRLELERRAAENAATDRLLAEVKPSPRSLDPRRNRDAYNRRQNKKSPTVAPVRDSE